jgi:hypothetical protein
MHPKRTYTEEEAEHLFNAHTPDIDGEGGFRVAFGAIDEVVGSTVDDHVRLHRREHGLQRGGLCEVGLLPAQSVDLARQTGTEVAAQLSHRAENSETHRNPS